MNLKYMSIAIVVALVGFYAYDNFLKRTEE